MGYIRGSNRWGGLISPRVFNYVGELGRGLAVCEAAAGGSAGAVCETANPRVSIGLAAFSPPSDFRVEDLENGPAAVRLFGALCAPCPSLPPLCIPFSSGA